ncbi:MAG: FAD-dependent oxidoreductase, partial [candidate division Zixibacteria bacterium]|nr:FAD-dependent oxidoreductase [candidate division Zixibacteria bacterium]
MRNSAECVIIGGGIIGASIAFHLSKLGMKDICILEKEKFLGAGATAKCAGGIRAQFSSEINVKISLLSEDLFERFTEDTGEEGIFDQVGYLFLVTTDEDTEVFQQNLKLQQSVGAPVEWLEREDIKDLLTNVRTDDVIGGTFCKKDGIGDPHVFTQGYVNASRRMGVDILEEVEATGIKTESGKITSVETSRGTISTPLVINCAGPEAEKIGRMAGIEIPVKPYKRQISTTSPLSWLPDSFPMVVDIASGLYCHKESGGLLLGWADKDTPPGYDQSLDPEYTDEILMRALDRIPILEEAGIATSWAGLYETTPDHHAILGKVPEVEGFLCANGFSGHGFMHAPGVGLLMAELI